MANKKQREWLIDARYNKGRLTQAKVAAGTGIPKSTYASYEEGVRTPGEENADKLSRYFGIPLEKFLEPTE